MDWRKRHRAKSTNASQPTEPDPHLSNIIENSGWFEKLRWKKGRDWVIRRRSVAYAPVNARAWVVTDWARKDSRFDDGRGSDQHSVR